MPLAIFAACFVFIFCQPRHTPHHRSEPASKSYPQTNTVRAPLTFKGCRDVVANFHDSWGNRDDYVGAYRISDQHAVLVCLDAYEKTGAGK